MTTAASAPSFPYSRREQVGWYFYDWANSAFSTTVVTVFLGPYLTTVTQNAADADGFVRPFGIPILADSFFPFVVSLSVLLAGLLPAHFGRNRRLLESQEAECWPSLPIRAHLRPWGSISCRATTICSAVCSLSLRT